MNRPLRRLKNFTAAKVLLPSLVLVMATFVARAQEPGQVVAAETAPKVRFGLKAGINIASLRLSSNSGSRSADTKSVAGFVGGVTLAVPFADKWNFHTGLEVSMKGFEVDLTAGGTLNSSATYIQLPLEVGYSFNLGTKWHLEPRLGFYAAYGIGGKSTLSGYSGEAKTFGDKILKEADFGIGFGVCFDNSKFLVGFRGEAGLTKADGDNFTVTGATVHTSNFTIMLGYMF